MRVLNASVTVNGQSYESDNNRSDNQYAEESRWHSDLVGIHHICHVIRSCSEFGKSDDQTHQKRHDYCHIKSEYVGRHARRKAVYRLFFWSSVSHRNILFYKGKRNCG